MIAFVHDLDVLRATDGAIRIGRRAVAAHARKRNVSKFMIAAGTFGALGERTFNVAMLRKCRLWTTGSALS